MTILALLKSIHNLATTHNINKDIVVTIDGKPRRITGVAEGGGGIEVRCRKSRNVKRKPKP